MIPLAVLSLTILTLYTAIADARRAPVNVRRDICQVFGRYCQQAVNVAYCETGGTFDVYARNGQYLGIFQMGSYARARYGHSSSVLGQSRSAFRYFVDTGRDWSPWECAWAAY